MKEASNDDDSNLNLKCSASERISSSQEALLSESEIEVNLDDKDFKFSNSPNFENVRTLVNEFAKERNWGKYHTPRNLLLAMVGEVGELAELFQWRGEVKEGLSDWTADEKTHLGEELSDVFIYLLRLSEKCHIDLPAAVMRKIELNKQKYPAPKVYGSNKKYTEYE